MYPRKMKNDELCCQLKVNNSVLENQVLDSISKNFSQWLTKRLSNATELFSLNLVRYLMTLRYSYKVFR